MTITHFTLTVATTQATDIVDISADVAQCLEQAGSCREGLAHLFIPGSTAALTTIEYERGAVEDLKNAIERMAPRDRDYAHDRRWGDGNGYAHVRAALMGPSLTVPVRNGELQLGPWQQIVLCDFDNRPRNRTILVQIHGDA